MGIAGVFRILLRAAFVMALLGVTGIVAAATIVVNSAADGLPADDGQCTLREAIIAANTNTASGVTLGECTAGTAGADVITFAISGGGVHTIGRRPRFLSSPSRSPSMAPRSRAGPQTRILSAWA